MSYNDAIIQIMAEDGVEISTMMNSPCLRYKGEFMAMMFSKADALIIKVSAERVNELIANGTGLEFNFTKKRFKEWVMIPLSQAHHYTGFVREALAYAQLRVG